MAVILHGRCRQDRVGEDKDEEGVQGQKREEGREMKGGRGREGEEGRERKGGRGREGEEGRERKGGRGREGEEGRERKGGRRREGENRGQGAGADEGDSFLDVKTKKVEFLNQREGLVWSVPCNGSIMISFLGDIH
eukprot:749446-Hanusia_phi.AAC.3